MMAQSASFIVLVTALLIKILSYCSAENVYCVIPTATSCSSCPHISTHCATLSEYAQKAEMYFTSDTIIMFTPGDHVLDRNVTVANATRLTIYGESSSDNIATVVRNGSVGFSFTNMVDFSILFLAFTSYNRFWSYGSHPASNSALVLQSIPNAKLVNCSFHDNIGTALAVNNTSVTLVDNKFMHNQCACRSFGDMLELGCGVTTFNSNLTFTGNTSFHNSTQMALYAYVNCAGAIWTSASSLHFTGTNNFIGNSANGINGVGAIYAEANTSLSFSGTSNFIHNLAEVGGAIGTVDNVIVTFNGTNVFFNNSASDSGGAIFASSNTSLSFTGASHFSHNSAEHFNGGAIAASDHVVLTFNGTNNFINNSANIGGAINTLDNAILIFNGTNNFINNSANKNSGGAIHAVTNTSLNFVGASSFGYNSAGDKGGAIATARDGVLGFNGTNNFINNSANKIGGAIHALTNISFIFIGASNFSHNSAGYEGGAIVTGDGVLIFNGTNNFFNNTANNGGAISTQDNAVFTFNGTNTFINNSANKNSGGAIHAVANISLTFIGAINFSHNSAVYEGGAVVTAGDGVLIFNGTNNFINNSANILGGAIETYGNAILIFNGTNNFINNSAEYGGAIDTFDNAILIFNGTNNFINNSAKNGGAIFAETNICWSFTGNSSFFSNFAVQGGAIFNYGSKLTFNGNINFTNNGHNTRDSRGGALYLAFSSEFSVSPNTTVCWENNHATLGGAIYVLNVNPFIYCTQISTYIPEEECFLQLPDQNIFGVQLIFKNNSAETAGSVLYGGIIDNCILKGYYKSNKVFDMLSDKGFTNIAQYQADYTTSTISSDPFRICPCDSNNHPNCSKSSNSNDALTLSIYPGETFQVSLVSTGQRNGIVPAEVRSHIDRGRLLSSQYAQQTTKMCTTLNYTVFSLQNVTIELYADGPCSTFGDKLTFELNINQTCPPGFQASLDETSCVCNQALQKHTNLCNITNGLGRITRQSDDTFWVGYDQSQSLVIVHPHCPFDYCVNDTVAFPLNNTDTQCAYNRSGFLCGACNNRQCNESGACNGTRYSLVLGSSHCKQCTNIYLLLLIPFALMGVVLVFFLLVCKLTVAAGTLSGLVFYANIVGVNHTIFLPVGSTDALSVFIAWLNLDFGIETCFYEGMDAYSKTWLQFVFPAYLWVLVGLMILISHFSQSFANLLGSNPVSALATLILLSYAKILRTLITAVYVTYFEYSANYSRRVWLHDANIDYLSGKHIPLFLVAILVFLFLFLPYILLLVLDQWLQAISHLRLFSWVNSARLKPFMDSYHAPYKAKHRYWPGLLLVIRFVLLLVFALNPQQDPNINLLAILVGAGILQLWVSVSGGVYKNWCLDALEGSFVLNLIILVGATYYINNSKGSKFAVGYMSVTIAFVTFIGILVYHIFQQLRHTKLWKKMPKLNLKLNKVKNKQAVNNLNNPINDPTESVNLDQLREPWLEDLLQPTHSSL